MTTDVTISCPHCRRQYTMKVDPERLQRLKMRATCGRCGNSFDVGSRIAALPESGPKPDLSTLQRIPAPAAPPMTNTATRPGATPTQPDLADEMAELAREFADAAARFTPVGVRPVAAHAPTTIEATPVRAPAPLDEPVAPLAATPLSLPLDDDAAVTSPSLPVAETTPAPLLSDAPALLPGDAPAPLPSDAPAPLPSDALSPLMSTSPSPPMEAPPSLPLTITMTAEDASAEFDAESITSARKAPKSWIDLADPGLAAFKTPPDAAAAALEALLRE